MQKHLLILLLLYSLNILAQENNKYIMLKPLTWDELQLYQLDSLKTADELKLASHCPSTLRKLQTTYTLSTTGFQHILGTNYIWSEFSNNSGEKCLVLHEKIDSITQKTNKIINPNTYELLDTLQARVLLSASQGVGFKKKRLFEQARQVNRYNQKLQNKPFEKYGGIDNVLNYMQKHKAAYKIDKKFLEGRTKIENGTVTTKQLPLIQLFELRYSEEQRMELINSTQDELNDSKKLRECDELSLDKCDKGKGFNLLKTLKNQKVSPLTYFIYQIYANSNICNGEYNEFKTKCMEFPIYDKEKNILTLSFLSEFREIEANNNIKKIAENPINDLTIELGIGGKTKGLIQKILEDYEIPITIKNNYLYLDDNPICINVSLLIGIDTNLYSYFGLRDCNGEIKVIKKLRAYAL